MLRGNVIYSFGRQLTTLFLQKPLGAGKPLKTFKTAMSPLLHKVGMDLGLAPHPLGEGAPSASGSLRRKRHGHAAAATGEAGRPRPKVLASP